MEARGASRKAGLEVGGNRYFTLSEAILESRQRRDAPPAKRIFKRRSDPQAKWSDRSLRDTKR
jgi:hypothetical protein